MKLKNELLALWSNFKFAGLEILAVCLLIYLLCLILETFSVKILARNCRTVESIWSVDFGKILHKKYNPGVKIL